jgi:hypothetical protein
MHNPANEIIRIRLLFNGSVLPGAQLVPIFCFLDKPENHPPCDATPEMRGDESERRWPEGVPGRK